MYISKMRSMKYIAYTVLILVGFGIISCTADADFLSNKEETDTESYLLGEWTTVDRVVSRCDVSDLNYSITYQSAPCMEGDADGCAYQKVTFEGSKMISNHVDVFYGGLFDVSDEIDYEFQDDVLNLCEDGECTTYRAQLNLDILTLTIDKDEDGCTDVWRLKRI